MYKPLTDTIFPGTDYFQCNQCASICNTTSGKRHVHCGGKRHTPIKRTFKFVELALAHPQGLADLVNIFPDMKLKNYLR